jgi:outer membrane protein OmpA-like peptidoglycan-associated protein
MNILSLIENQLSPQTINPISKAIGESPEATKTALGTAVPGLLGSLLGKVSSPNGATDIFNMLKQGGGQGGWSDNISNIAQGMTGGAPSANQESLLASLLGSKLGPVSDFISSHAGVRSGSAMSLLGMAAPLLMGTLGKQVSSQGLNAGGLGQLLTSQIPFLKNALPSGLANTLGINNVLSGTQKIAQPAEAAYRQASTMKTPAVSGALKWAGAAALLAIIGWLVASHSNRSTEVGGTSETNLNTVATGHGYGNADMSSLHLPAGSAGDKVANAISSGDWNKTIDLEGFSTDSAGALSDSAKTGIGEVGKVLSAYPNIKVRITGHGATEESGVNEANSIKSALVAAGISEDRISTSGQAAPGNPTLNLVQGQSPQ